MVVKYVSDFEFPASAGFKVQKYAKGGMVADESRYESKGPKTRYTAAKGRREAAERKMRHAEKYAPGLSLDMSDKPAGKMSKFAKGGPTATEKFKAEIKSYEDLQAKQAATKAREAAFRKANSVEARAAAARAAAKPPVSKGPTRKLRPAPDLSYMPVPDGGRSGGMPSNDMQMFSKGGKMVKGRKGGGKC